MIIGIVGSEARKFTEETEAKARAIIRELLSPPDSIVCSGGCHLGGIDIWAEEEADALGREKIIHVPRVRNWSEGYKPRNLAIARDSDIVHCITVRELPPSYTGMKFPFCYHCGTDTHVKSGGCWTMHRAKKGMLHVVA